MRKKRNLSFREKYLDYDFKKSSPNLYLLFFLIVLAVFGLVSILSASSYLTIKYDLPWYNYIKNQGFAFILGFVIMFSISKLNYQFYKDYSLVLYFAGIILVAMVYVPGISVAYKGARRWIKLGITFMPSDFMKVIAIIYLSKYLSDNRKNKDDFLLSVIFPGLIIVFPFILILLQTDLSTSLIVASSLAIVYLINGVRGRFLLPIIVIVGLAGFFVIKSMKGYQIDRLTAFLDPEADYQDISWQVLNGLFAVSRGGLSGVGYGKSIYKHGYLANEVNSDMIYSVISEEFGFVGSVLLILLVLTITFIILSEALKTKDHFAKLTCTGIAMVYFLQSFMNIGVAIGIVPNTGITLPFISNGGTSIVAFCIMFGIVLNISRENNFRHMEEVRMAKMAKKAEYY